MLLMLVPDHTSRIVALHYERLECKKQVLVIFISLVLQCLAHTVDGKYNK